VAKLEVTRLLQNPLGDLAPEGERGDIVRISDGVQKIYLTPHEFDRIPEKRLRELLALKAAGLHRG
jgi:ribosomal protein L9